MKKEIHPTYYQNATIKCACGNKITVGSTKKETDVEICANCHPFFTGKEKLIDIEGRVEKFKQKMEKSQKIKSKQTTEKSKAKNKKTPKK
ncbi:50S ribosomal protein L31 [Patescibacteria group bacterium]|nr:50S ribosomal protein L31 [Patescibacteria group bacterium]MBU2633306.1 50S ribosomal protein L31 [Patescibacteria group bacterium]